MEFLEWFSNLTNYAFQRLRALLDQNPAGGDVENIKITDPKRALPAWGKDILVVSMGGLNSYPTNNGSSDIRNAIADWAKSRFAVGIDMDTHVIALNGMR